jgi:hypothetical protein
MIHNNSEARDGIESLVSQWKGISTAQVVQEDDVSDLEDSLQSIGKEIMNPSLFQNDTRHEEKLLGPTADENIMSLMVPLQNQMAHSSHDYFQTSHSLPLNDGVDRPSDGVEEEKQSNLTPDDTTKTPLKQSNRSSRESVMANDGNVNDNEDIVKRLKDEHTFPTPTESSYISVSSDRVISRNNDDHHDSEASRSVIQSLSSGLSHHDALYRSYPDDSLFLEQNPNHSPRLNRFMDDDPSSNHEHDWTASFDPSLSDDALQPPTRMSPQDERHDPLHYMKSTVCSSHHHDHDPDADIAPQWHPYSNPYGRPHSTEKKKVPRTNSTRRRLAYQPPPESIPRHHPSPTQVELAPIVVSNHALLGDTLPRSKTLRIPVINRDVLYQPTPTFSPYGLGHEHPLKQALKKDYHQLNSIMSKKQPLPDRPQLGATHLLRVPSD